MVPTASTLYLPPALKVGKHAFKSKPIISKPLYSDMKLQILFPIALLWTNTVGRDLERLTRQATFPLSSVAHRQPSSPPLGSHEDTPEKASNHMVSPRQAHGLLHGQEQTSPKNTIQSPHPPISRNWSSMACPSGSRWLPTSTSATWETTTPQRKPTP